MAVHESLGFQNHPFAKTNADEEVSLHEYFVPPPFFDAIIGDAKAPKQKSAFLNILTKANDLNIIVSIHCLKK